MYISKWWCNISKITERTTAKKCLGILLIGLLIMTMIPSGVYAAPLEYEMKNYTLDDSLLPIQYEIAASKNHIVIFDNYVFKSNGSENLTLIGNISDYLHWFANDTSTSRVKLYGNNLYLDVYYASSGNLTGIYVFKIKNNNIILDKKLNIKSYHTFFIHKNLMYCVQYTYPERIMIYDLNNDTIIAEKRIELNTSTRSAGTYENPENTAPFFGVWKAEFSFPYIYVLYFVADNLRLVQYEVSGNNINKIRDILIYTKEYALTFEDKIEDFTISGRYLLVAESYKGYGGDYRRNVFHSSLYLFDLSLNLICEKNIDYMGDLFSNENYFFVVERKNAAKNPKSYIHVFYASDSLEEIGKIYVDRYICCDMACSENNLYMMISDSAYEKPYKIEEITLEGNPPESPKIPLSLIVVGAVMITTIPVSLWYWRRHR